VEKIIWTDRFEKLSSIIFNQGVGGGILHTVKTGKANRFGHILRKKGILKHAFE